MPVTLVPRCATCIAPLYSRFRFAGAIPFTERPATADEQAQWAADAEEQAAAQAEREAQQAAADSARRKIAEASGLTPEEMAALGF